VQQREYKACGRAHGPGDGKDAQVICPLKDSERDILTADAPDATRASGFRPNGCSGRGKCPAAEPER